MKRLISTILSVFLVGALAMGQSYFYTPFTSPGMNPGGLNTDDEQPWGFLDATYPGEYDSLIGPSGSAIWSQQQLIPFNFEFAGNNVTQYYVSSTGVVTFSNTPGTAPSDNNMAIPDAAIPDMSVMVWGLNTSGGNDAVVSKTFGTAPNRQHWIIWASASEAGLVGGAKWAYWGIAFEETTNKIFIVDMRTYDDGGGNVSITAGVQVNSTTAVSVAGSPNFNAATTATGGSSSLTDNAYYAFQYGSPPNYDVGVTAINVDGTMDPVSLNNNHTVGGSLLNYGVQTLTSFDVTYSIDGGSGVTYNVSGVNVPLGASYDFQHGTPWNPTTGGGTFANVEVSISNLNGNVDENPTDNEIDADFFLNLGVTTTKNVLLEEFSTAPCGFCPDGLLVIDDILATVNNVILAQIHAGFGTDAMTIPAHSQWASVFTTGAPTAMVDRILWEGEPNVGFSRSIWKQKVQERLNHPAPVELLISGNYNDQTGNLDVDVTAAFKDYAVPGDYRINLYIIEDDVTGTGSGYDQRNYYSSAGAAAGGPSHPYFSEPDPIPGYEHSMVIRAVPSSTWGNSGVIPSSPEPSQNYMNSYTVTLDPNWDDEKIYLVAYVSRFDIDPGNRPILNSGEVKLSDLGVGISAPTVDAEIELYPNPANELSQVAIDLPETSDVTVEVVNTLGQHHTVFAHSATYAAGKQYVTLPTTDWASGVYMVNIRVNDATMVKKLIVTH